MIDYDKIISAKTKEIKPSGIRKFFDIANTLDNVISLSIGEPDFKTPWAIRKEAINVLEKGKTRYTSNAGLDGLREAIAEYLEQTIRTSYDPKSEILVTIGGSEAIDATFRAIIEEGDEILIP